jgi:hypothetical protein
MRSRANPTFTDIAFVRRNGKGVMPADSRSKNGVASLAYVAGIHVLILLN